MITIREYKTEDLESVMDIWNEVVREGIAFPQDEELTKLNADDFFTGQSYTGVAVNVGKHCHIAKSSRPMTKSGRSVPIV